MEILKAFRVSLFVFMLNLVLAQSRVIVGSFLIPPIKEPQNFIYKTFKASQVQRDPNISGIQHNYYHKHILKIPIDENYWTPIENPRMHDKIDIRSSDIRVQERIVSLGEGNHKYYDAANINQIQLPNFNKIQPFKNTKVPEESVGLTSFPTIPSSAKYRIDESDRNFRLNRSKALFVKSNIKVGENKSLLLEGEERLKKIEEKLANVLRAFEGNLSKILDIAVTNASSRENLKNSNESIYHIHRAARQQKSGTDLMTEEIYSLPRPIQPNPSISGPPSFTLIGRRARPLAETGYVSPPILKFNSNGHGNGTYDYGAEHGPQEVGEGAFRSIVGPEQSNFFTNNTKSIINKQGEVGVKHKRTHDRHVEDIKIRNNDRHSERISIEDVSKSTVKDIPSKQFDVSIDASDKLRASDLKRDVKSKRNFEEDDKKVSETIVRGRAISALHTSIDLKGLNTFNPGFNSPDHSPPDPYVALFLSHYGRYLPQSAPYRNLYSYLASNNLHNNKPFGAYKIYEDADG